LLSLWLDTKGHCVIAIWRQKYKILLPCLQKMDGSIISENNLPTVDVVIILISFLLSLYSSGLMILY